MVALALSSLFYVFIEIAFIRGYLFLLGHSLPIMEITLFS